MRLVKVIGNYTLMLIDVPEDLVIDSSSIEHQFVNRERPVRRSAIAHQNLLSGTLCIKIVRID